MKNLREEIKMMSVNQISVYHTLLEAYNVMRHLSSEQINKRWKLIERKYALRSTTKKQLNVPEKPKLKCLGFTYNQKILDGLYSGHTYKIIGDDFDLSVLKYSNTGVGGAKINSNCRSL